MLDVLGFGDHRWSRGREERVEELLGRDFTLKFETGTTVLRVPSGEAVWEIFGKGYGPEKIRLVLNRADSTLGIRVADVEHSIGRKVDHTIVSDGRSVVYALNRGVPFFLSNREAQVSQDIQRLAIRMFQVMGSNFATSGWGNLAFLYQRRR